MNKVVLTFILVFALAFTVKAQIPQGMNYQAVLRNANGEIMSNTNVQLRFTIKRSFFDIAYQGEYYPSTNEFGLVNLTIGAYEDELNPNYGNFASIDWVSYYDWYLQVELWQNGAWLDLGSQYILSVPYANHAHTSSYSTDMFLQDLDGINFENLGDGMTLVFDGINEEWVLQPLVTPQVDVWSSDATNTWRLSGNVGVGITTPTSKLHVHDGGIRLSNGAFGSGLIDGFYIGQDANTGNALLSNFESTDMIFSTGFLERFRLGANGPIVPLDYPGHKFHLKSTYPGLGMHLTYTNSGHLDTDGTRIGLNSSSELEVNQQENADIIFKRNGVEKLAITNNGLDVSGDVQMEDLACATVSTVAITTNSIDANHVDAQTMKLSVLSGTGNRPVLTDASGNIFPDFPEYKFISLGPSDLQAWSNIDIGDADATIDFEVEENPHQFAFQENPGNNFYVTLHLPHGVKVLSAKANIKDFDDGLNMAVRFSTFHALTGNENNTSDFEGFAVSSVDTGAQQLNFTFGDGEIIDNENNLYVLTIDRVGDEPLFGSNADDFKVVSVIVKYMEVY